MDGLYKETAGGRVAMDGADKILHWGLVGQLDQVCHMVDDQPRQVLSITQVLTLERHKYRIIQSSY
jgi:hypothetical protein